MHPCNINYEYYINSKKMFEQINFQIDSQIESITSQKFEKTKSKYLDFNNSFEKIIDNEKYWNTIAEAMKPTLEAMKPTTDIQRAVAEAMKPTLEAMKSTIDIQRAVAEAMKPILESMKPTIDIQRAVAEGMDNIYSMKVQTTLNEETNK